MDKYYQTSDETFIITPADATLQVKNSTKEHDLTTGMVPIDLWEGGDFGTILLYDRNTHTVYKSDTKPLMKLSGENPDSVKRFGNINSVGNILIIQESSIPSKFEIFEPMAEDIQAMYQLPIKNTNIYALYGKDKVTLFKRTGMGEIKDRLKKVKDKKAKLTLWDIKLDYSTMTYIIDTSDAINSTKSVGDFLATKFTADNSPTFIIMDHESFNQAFFPKRNLPTGAEPLQPEEYSKFENIESNTSLLPFKKNNEYYALAFNNFVIPLGSNPEKVKGIYGSVHDYSYYKSARHTVTKVEDDTVTIYSIESEASNRTLNKAKEFKKFEHVRGFGINMNGLDYVIEDNKGVLHAYLYNTDGHLVTGNIPGNLIEATTLKNTLSHGLTPEAAQQYLSVICQ